MAVHQLATLMPATITDDAAVAQTIDEMLHMYPDAMLESGKPTVDRTSENLIVTVTFSSQIYDNALEIASRAIFGEMRHLVNHLDDAPFLTQEQAGEYRVVITALIDRVSEVFGIEEDK